VLLCDKMIMGLQQRNSLEKYDRSLLEELNKTTVILIDNVARYYYEDSDQEYWDLQRDFPNVAPPLRSFFMEFSSPKFVRHEGIIDAVTRPTYRTGLLFSYDETKDVKNESVEKFSKQVGAKWIATIVIFYDYGGNISRGPMCSLLIKPDGRIGEIPPSFVVGLYKNYVDNMRKCGFSNDEVTDSVAITIEPALLAISFMHCKNVTVRKVTIPAGLIRKARKKHHHELIRYHILDIEPMKKVLRSEGNSEKTGLKRALHICRGHFKDYNDGKGLFGRIHGLYWWEQHLRGSVEEGIVNKDYEVHSVDEEAQNAIHSQDA